MQGRADEDGRPDRALRAGLTAFGLFQLAQGAWMAAAPGSFFARIGPFGARNVHYVRDVSTTTLALAVVLLVASRHRAWRIPVLAYATLQFGLHVINHLVDIDAAHPAWVGPADAAALAAGGALLAWMLTAAVKEARP
jgi:hypothetical protein